ncbi:MAG: L-fucose/L-arabinose isomerase family protein [Anaerolineae bacterium]|nr:L-fucose/L-arabinose isomerase family protein [Anaerolineae bacterium]
MFSVGFAALLRTTFDVPYAEQMIAAARTSLESHGFRLVGGADPVTDADAAIRCGHQLAELEIDAVVVLQATFADSTMVRAIAEQIDVPLLLWALPEPHTGGRLRLNSLCGINLGAHALRRAGLRYHTAYADPSDPAVIAQLDALVRANRIRRALSSARIGVIGEHPTGFDTCRYDAAELRARLGVEVVPVPLRERVFADARAVDAGAVDALMTEMQGRLQGITDDAPTRGTLATYAALEKIAGEEALNGCAVRCWPEFFTELGCAACGAMSMLTDSGIPASCEADVNGTITQVILAQASGEAAFGSDIVSLDSARDALVLWHCGLAPLSMADKAEQPKATLHSNRRLPLLMDFMLKPGTVTVARLSEAGGEMRLVLGRGEIIRGEKPFSGTTGLIRFARPAQEVLGTILAEGLEHHIALTYGDHLPALLALAQMLELPVLEL